MATRTVTVVYECSGQAEYDDIVEHLTTHDASAVYDVDLNEGTFTITVGRSEEIDPSELT